MKNYVDYANQIEQMLDEKELLTLKIKETYKQAKEDGLDGQILQLAIRARQDPDLRKQFKALMG